MIRRFVMEDIDVYLRLCMRQYAAKQDLDEYRRERLLKAANEKPGAVSTLLAPFHTLGLRLARIEKRLAAAPNRLFQSSHSSNQS
jgi:hypothetical protein